MTKRKKTHHPLFRLWCNTRQFCNNPRNKQYQQYGGRGIKWCRQWNNDFWRFADWMDQNLGPRPQGHVLDRINNNRGYYPGNLRWATKRQDSNNKSNNIYITYQGQKLTLAEWSLKQGIHLTTIWSRLIDNKWPVAQALGFKPRKK